MSVETAFMSPEEAYVEYGLDQRNSLLASDLDRQLVGEGIARIIVPIENDDIETIFSSFEECIAECPAELTKTAYTLDSRTGNEVGFRRKEEVSDLDTGVQLEDAKNYMHFTEGCEVEWERFRRFGADPLRKLVNQGLEIHRAVIALAQDQTCELEDTHPNISRLYFPDPGISRIFTRLISYDGYEAGHLVGDVGKPHKDIGGFTMHVFDDAPGLQAQAADDSWVDYQASPGQGFMFMGDGHEKVYGADARIRAKRHRVARQAADGRLFIPKRHSLVVFVDAPQVDYKTAIADVLPQVAKIRSGESAA